MPLAEKTKLKSPAVPRRARGFLAVFCAVIGLSFPLFNLFSKQLSLDNHENRFLTSLPAVLAGPLRAMPAGLDAFFADNAPFRYQLVLLNANLDYTLFDSSQSDQVLAGREGWLFYKDGPNAAQPMANYQGLACINDSPEQLAAAAAGLQALSDALAANGCTLVLDLTPSKDRIYREYMPAAYPIVNEQNRTDLFAAAMQAQTTVPINWQYEKLRTAALAAPAQPLYFKTDTHWNHAGALAGLDGVLAAAGLETRPFAEYSFAVSGQQTGDMANVAALYTLLPAEDDYLPTAYMFAPDPRTVGVIGDSFSEYYMPYLEQRFAASWRQTPDTLTPALAAAPGCDLLILEANERSLDTLNALLAQFG